MSKKKVMPTFGSAGYLIMKFDDINEAVESKSSAAAKDAKKIENKLVCKNCGARKIPREDFQKYYCRRHGFYVHSMGYCPAFSTEEYVPPAAPKPSPYKQPWLL